MKLKKMNKKGLAPAIPAVIWGVGAVLAGLGYLISQFKTPTGMAAIPVWGWLVGGLVIIILLKKK